jgi:hypothetical protein
VYYGSGRIRHIPINRQILTSIHDNHANLDARRWRNACAATYNRDGSTEWWRCAMTRFFGLLGLSALLLVNVGCGTMCHKRAPSCPPSPAFVAPPPPAPLVPAGGVTFGPPAQSFPPAQNFPTAPAQNFPSAPAQNFPTAPGAAFGQPDAPFPKAPPSITPMPPNNVQPRFESKWQPGENPDVKPRVNADVQPRENPDVKPRVQLYAPEAVPDRPRITEDPPAAKRPGATFPAIPQFAEVKANVYSGLRPGAAGLDWLQSNRLGTVVTFGSPARTMQPTARKPKLAACAMLPSKYPRRT